MSAPNFITIAGNLTAAPEPRRTSSEVPLTRMRIAVSRRIFVPETSQWEDRQDGFFQAVCWRDMARHVASSLHKGDRVIVSGRLTRREYEAKNEDGTTGTRYTTEIDVEELGASLRWNSWQKVQTRPLNEATDPAAVGEDEKKDDGGHGEGDDDDASSEALDRVVAPAA